MNKRTAIIIFLVLSVGIVVLLTTGTIRPVVGGTLFALTLLILGGLSGGFRNDGAPPAS